MNSNLKRKHEGTKVIEDLFPGFLKRIREDRSVKYVGLVGSRARGTHKESSDIDIAIVVEDPITKQLDGVHYIDKINYSELDVILFAEHDIHHNTISLYAKECILRQEITLIAKCDTCDMQFGLWRKAYQKAMPLSSLEYSNIIWHLEHISRKLRSLKQGSPLHKIFSCKMVYYACLLFPRLLDENVLGEAFAHDLMNQHNRCYKAFLDLLESCNHMSYECAERFIEELMSYKGRIGDDGLYFEGKRIICPYAPPTTSRIMHKHDLDEAMNNVRNWFFTR